ncbi:MAG: hypothetical protein R2912_07020 [Eubacteriales bacterium]
MIDLTKNKEGLQHSIERAREKGIIIPKISQMRNPDLIPDSIKEQLTNVGLWDINPLNLFRISWRNEPKEFGGKTGGRQLHRSSVRANRSQPASSCSSESEPDGLP